MRALRSRTRGGSWLRSVAWRRSCASAIAWNVPAVIRPSTPSRPMRDDELAGRLAGERDREHVARLDAALAGAVRDPAREHPGLARAGGREDRERRRVGGDRVVLDADRDRRAARRARPGRYTVGCDRRIARRGRGARRCDSRNAARPRVVFAALAAPISSGPSLRRRNRRACPRRRPPTDFAGSVTPAPKARRTSRPARTSVPSPQAGSESDASANR